MKLYVGVTETIGSNSSLEYPTLTKSISGSLAGAASFGGTSGVRHESCVIRR